MRDKTEEIIIANFFLGFLVGPSVKEPACQCRRHKRCGFDPQVGKIPRGGHGNPLQYS